VATAKRAKNLSCLVIVFYSKVPTVAPGNHTPSKSLKDSTPYLTVPFPIRRGLSSLLGPKSKYPKIRAHPATEIPSFS